MADAFPRILYPALVLTIVATVWAMGLAQARGEAAERRYWPALDPELFRQINEASAATDDQPRQRDGDVYADVFDIDEL